MAEDKDINVGDLVIVIGDLRNAKYLGLISSFGFCNVLFEGDSEPTRVHYNEILPK